MLLFNKMMFDGQEINVTLKQIFCLFDLLLKLLDLLQSLSMSQFFLSQSVLITSSLALLIETCARGAPSNLIAQLVPLLAINVIIFSVLSTNLGIKIMGGEDIKRYNTSFSQKLFALTLNIAQIVLFYELSRNSYDYLSIDQYQNSILFVTLFAEISFLLALSKELWLPSIGAIFFYTEFRYFAWEGQDQGTRRVKDFVIIVCLIVEVLRLFYNDRYKNNNQEMKNVEVENNLVAVNSPHPINSVAFISQRNSDRNGREFSFKRDEQVDDARMLRNIGGNREVEQFQIQADATGRFHDQYGDQWELIQCGQKIQIKISSEAQTPNAQKISQILDDQIKNSQLQNSQIYKTFLEYLPTGVLQINQASRVLFANEECKKLFPIFDIDYILSMENLWMKKDYQNYLKDYSDQRHVTAGINQKGGGHQSRLLKKVSLHYSVSPKSDQKANIADEVVPEEDDNENDEKIDPLSAFAAVISPSTNNNRQSMQRCNYSECLTNLMRVCKRSPRIANSQTAVSQSVQSSLAYLKQAASQSFINGGGLLQNREPGQIEIEHLSQGEAHCSTVREQLAVVFKCLQESQRQDFEVLDLRIRLIVQPPTIRRPSGDSFLKIPGFSEIQRSPISKDSLSATQEQPIYEIIIIPYVSQGESNVLMLISNMSNINRLKTLQEISENKSRMLRDVSHEFRTPLNCIISMLELMQHSLSPQLRTDYLIPALYSGKQLMCLLNDILDLAQLKSGKFRVVSMAMSLQIVLYELYKMLKMQAEIKGVELHLDTGAEGDLPEFIYSDSNRIKQIVTNLVGNALKFTESGSVTISVKSIQSNNYEIAVRDTGIGISEENINQLFREFGKLTLDKTQLHMNVQGVGLGLQISDKIARALNSRRRGLDVQSSDRLPDRGTRFSFIVTDNRDSEFATTPRSSYIDPSAMTPSMRREPRVHNFGGFSHALAIQQEAMSNSRGLILAQPIRQQVSGESSQLSNFGATANQLPPSFISTMPIGKGRGLMPLQQTSIQKRDSNKQMQMSGQLSQSSPRHSLPSMRRERQQQQFLTSETLPVNQIIIHPLSNIELELSVKEYSSSEENDEVNFAINSDKTSNVNLKNVSNQSIKRQQPRTVNGNQSANCSTPKKNFNCNGYANSGYSDNSLALSQRVKINPHQQVEAWLQQTDQEVDLLARYLRNSNSQKICACSDVLIIEDNAYAAFALERQLSNFGFRVEIAATRAIAIQRVSTKLSQACCQVYRLIFLDYNVGEVKGSIISREICDLHQEQLTERQPIILGCTGDDDYKTAQECKESGMLEVLVKPVNHHLLLWLLYSLQTK